MTTQETIDQAERIIAGLQWPTPHSSAHIAQALADAGLLSTSAERCATWNDLYRKIGDAEAERDEARATIQRLSRRAQLAEAALHKQLKHPNGAQDPTVNALAERVDEYRQRLWRARADIEYQKQLRRDVEAEHADCTTDLAIAEAQRDAALATIQRVRDLHYDFGGHCHDCDHDWPCPTIRALDQEDKS